MPMLLISEDKLIIAKATFALGAAVRKSLVSYLKVTQFVFSANVVKIIGVKKSIELFEETKSVEEGGGMLVNVS